MNLFVLFGDGAITRKKKKKTFNDAVSVIYFLVDTPSPNKKKKKKKTRGPGATSLT